MYLQNEDSFGRDGGSIILTLGGAINLHDAPLTWRERWVEHYAHFNFTPDLGAEIGSTTWWRGLLTCTAIISSAILLKPVALPIAISGPPALTGAALEAQREQAIAPLGWGADSGSRMGPTRVVTRLSEAPERPQIDVLATLSPGEGLTRALTRAGVSGDEADAVSKMINDALPLEQISPGTTLALTLGNHAHKADPRPLKSLNFRARLDLKLSLIRDGSSFKLIRIPIAVDHTPLRVQGHVGGSFYAAARAAGIPMQSVEDAIHVLQAKVGFDNIDADAQFDLVVEQARAATGEIEHGKLLYIGLEHDDQTTRMIEWTIDGHTDWYDLAGVAERRAGFTVPVANAHKTSGFGMRFHPILGYSRMHQGVDYGAAFGSPIHAIADGIVNFAGWHGGHGNFVKLNHAYGLGSGYGHMSRIAVSPGTHVNQGDIIGYVGSTGLSTGPHLHFETYRNGAVVDPTSVKFTATSLLDGRQLAAFRAKIASFIALR